MVKFLVKAQLSKGSATVTINGISTEVSIDTVLEASGEGATLVEAKQHARAIINAEAFILLEIKAGLVLLEPKYAKLKYKGRTASNFAYWINVNIINIKILPE